MFAPCYAFHEVCGGCFGTYCFYMDYVKYSWSAQDAAYRASEIPLHTVSFSVTKRSFCVEKQICALIICDERVIEKTDLPLYAVPLLFTPLLQWNVLALRSAGIADICLLAKGCQPDITTLLQTEQSEVRLLPEEETAQLTAFVDSRDVVVIPAAAVLFESEPLRCALQSMQDGGKAVTVFDKAKKPCAYCCGTKEYAAVLENQAVDLAAPLFAESGCMAAIETAFDLHRATQLVLPALLEKHMREGVFIPDAKGILLAPDCTIGAGTQLLPDTILKEKVHIGQNCTIGPGCVLKDTNIGDGVACCFTVGEGAEIGDLCTVGPFARLRPGTKLGKQVRAGHFIEIKNANVGDGSKISHLSYIGDTNMGENTVVGCGCATANYDGKEKYRSEIGRDAFIGCGSILVAPVRVGEGAYTAAGSVITQDVPDSSLAIARSRQTNKENWQDKRKK